MTTAIANRHSSTDGFVEAMKSNAPETVLFDRFDYGVDYKIEILDWNNITNTCKNESYDRNYNKKYIQRHCIFKNDAVLVDRIDEKVINRESVKKGYQATINFTLISFCGKMRVKLQRAGINTSDFTQYLNLICIFQRVNKHRVVIKELHIEKVKNPLDEI